VALLRLQGKNRTRLNSRPKQLRIEPSQTEVILASFAGGN
jgi:hypothetical protein